MSKSLSKLRKQEYLMQFDVLCANIAGAVIFPPVPARDTPLMTEEEMTATRISMMLASYYKYGPVSANYLQNNLMLPLQDTITRIKKYEKTHNTEYLLDAVNYLMLAYWQYSSEVLSFSAEDAEHYTVSVRTAVECHSKLTGQIMFLLSEYAENSDLCWLAVIAVLLCNEVRYPRYTDAFYLYTQGTDCKTAGTYVNELEKLASVRNLESWC